MNNFFDELPVHLPEEFTEILVSNEQLRIEKIVSTGQCSPEDFWYDQEEHEWVMVLQGNAQLEFDDGRRLTMRSGDFVLINAHERHRVAETSSTETTVWLAVFFKSDVLNAH